VTSVAALWVDHPAYSPRVHAWDRPKRLTSKGKIGSGGRLPALFAEDYMYRPHLNRPPGS